MLTRTSLSAIRALIFLAENDRGPVMSPKRIAEAIGDSPTYMAKVTRQLVRAGILRAERGAKGGVELDRAPAEITLQAVVEACQGVMVGNYCHGPFDARTICSYHRAAAELQHAITGVLSRWTIGDLLARPHALTTVPGSPVCVMLRERGKHPAEGGRKPH